MRGIFLDRDGVLNENRHDYVKSWQEFRWLNGALAALAMLAEDVQPIIVVTNQSAVGRGLLASATLEDMHRRMRQEIVANGGRIDDIYACLHTPTDICGCRKPLPGLFQTAADQHHIELAASVFIGDAFTDFQAARAAGLAYIHVRTGRGSDDATRVLATDATVPIVADLQAAVPLVRRAGVRQLLAATA